MSKAYHARNQAVSEIAEDTEEFLPEYDSWDSHTGVSYGLRLEEGVPKNSYGDGGYGWRKGEVPIIFENEDRIQGFFVNILGEDYEDRLEDVKCQIMKADLFFNFNTEKEAEFEALVYDGSWEVGEFNRMDYDDIREELN